MATTSIVQELTSHEKNTHEEVLLKYKKRAKKVNDLAVNSKIIWKATNCLAAKYTRAHNRMKNGKQDYSSSEDEDDIEAKMAMYHNDAEAFKDFSQVALKLYHEFKHAKNHELKKYNCIQSF